MNLTLPGRERVSFHGRHAPTPRHLSRLLPLSIGLTALGLGTWGAFFPGHVKRMLGLEASEPAVRALFGERELITGAALVADPERADMLWARVAGDALDIAVLHGLDTPRNPRRNAARLALGFVLAVTALDVLAAVSVTERRRG